LIGGVGEEIGEDECVGVVVVVVVVVSAALVVVAMFVEVEG